MKREARIKEIAEQVMVIFEYNGRIPLERIQLKDAFRNDSDWTLYMSDVLDFLVLDKKWISFNEKVALFSLTDEGKEYLDSL